LERHVPLPHNPLAQAHRDRLTVLRYGNDFAKLRIADAKLDSDTLSSPEDRPHLGVSLVALHVTSYLSINLGTIDPGLTSGLDLDQEDGLHRSERAISRERQGL
jgi:hypothetical protein